jgi:putative transposase
MSIHTYTRLLVHVIWSTHEREPIIPKVLRGPLNEYFYNYCKENDIYLLKSYVNKEHVHALVDLKPEMALSDLVRLMKGSSSHWLNQQEEQRLKFSWQRGFGGFSVSESKVQIVMDYIDNQEEHHKKMTFAEEWDMFLKEYHLLGHN